MPSIQSSPHPLVFKLINASKLGLTAVRSDTVAVRTRARALEGMQKEAIVCCAPTGTAWRMVSDEGPYLNGTDLAPFPLAFFTAGMASSYMSEILALLRERKIGYRDVSFVQDSRYTMTGSAVKGTMTGGALPVDLNFSIEADADRQQLMELVASAVGASPASALLRHSLVSEFTLTVNDEPVPTGRVRALAGEPEKAPDGFDAAAPVTPADFPPDIISKLDSVQSISGVEGGAGSSLAPEQDRTLHVRGVCSMSEDGMKEICVQLLKPIGSVFRFLSDDSVRFAGRERAPSGLAYLSAGIAFCYMTQLGRYAHIVRKPLEDCRIVQDTHFSLPGASGGTRVPGSADPVRTHVYLKTPEGSDYGRTLVDMGEQTCFLHAACRSSLKTKVACNLQPAYSV